MAQNKKKLVLCHRASRRPGFGGSFEHWFWFRDSDEVTFKSGLELRVSQGSTRTAGSPSKAGSSLMRLTGAGCAGRPLCPAGWTCPQGRLSVFTARQLASPVLLIQGRAKQKQRRLLGPSLLRLFSVISTISYWLQVSPVHCRGELHEGMNTRSWESPGATLGAGYHS